ncbi:TetR/AcrR family transcriptional regulator [Dokdonella sp.]|uniref:TetR/AcrR family transcriptional regulator n=1 Tax=Dokdonella sp. TaxID=2291710 RepID=UPI002D1FA5B5|nr:TetR/AcrR family transcriptional regulator [Dokdonella sp.]
MQRKPGRPAKRPAGPDRRTRILDIATDLFGRHGVSATSMSAIARRARITPALMHYYFGNRESLLDALVEERLRPAVAEVAQQMATAREDLRELVECFVRSIIKAVASRPWFPPLWVREVLSEGGMLRERVIDGMGLALIIPLRDRFAAAQRTGALNRDLDPNLLVVTLVSLTLFPFASQSIWRARLGASQVSADTIASHALALLDRGLEIPR